MAKEADLFSHVYESLKFAAAATGSIGEVLQKNKVVGFLLEDISAAEVAASAEKALLTRANITLVQKTTGQAWTPGEAIYFDPATSKFTNVKGILQCCGYVEESALSAATTGYIMFIGTPQAGNGMLMRSGIATVTGTDTDIDTGLTTIVEVFVSLKDTTQGAGDAAYVTYDHGADGLLDLYCWDDAGSAASNAATVAWLALGN